IFKPSDVLQLLDDGLLSVHAREQWFDKKFRNGLKDESLHWDNAGIDDEIRRIANEEVLPEPRVARAGERGPGESWATDQYERRTDCFALARNMIVNNRIPNAVALHINSRQLSDPDDKARLLLQVFRNGEDARLASGSTINV